MGCICSSRAEESVVPPRQVQVIVQGGYHPSHIAMPEGERVRLTFVRREASRCTQEVVFPTLGIGRQLPLNQPVVIDLPALVDGDVTFHCGMDMARGAISVKPRR